MKPGILTLTTDFGQHGPYVAALKGTILGLAPSTNIVDVSHTIVPQNVLEGAFVLAGIVDSFPPGTIHLAVVDPGVGTERHLIAACVAGNWFILPDNGLISGVIRNRPLKEVREITNPAIRRREVAPTFHGRDILAPAAAFLLNGGDPSELGPIQERVIRLANFEPRSDDAGGLLGEVIFRDTFGNLVTNIPVDRLPPREEPISIQIASACVEGLSQTYGEQPSGTLVAVIGSTGWLEIAVVNGDAGRQLRVGPGTTVWLRPRK